MNDLESLDMLNNYISDQYKLLQEAFPNKDEIERIYWKYYESVFWILYLGNPKDWMGDRFFYRPSIILKDEQIGPAGLEEINDEELQISNIERVGKYDFKVSLGKDSIILPGDNGRMRKLYRPKINTRVPYVLLKYLTNQFGTDFGTESFMEEAIRKKKKK
jgi:hypothetical protein